MYYKAPILLLLFWNILSSNIAQPCTGMGQTPGTAFPVCGTAKFSQSTVPACGGRRIPVPCTDHADYGDLNPYWYKFTCFQSGTLGFTITPHTISDDYDWQLFDITGKNPEDVFTDASLYVTSNWSAVPGATGTAANASRVTNCSGFSNPNRSKLPTLKEGHDYLLLVSHFTSDNQSGYDLEFIGGTANITDPKEPHFANARAYCDGTEIILKFNKKMRCKTLASDGSDFTLSTNLSTIVSARAPGCRSGFDTDSVIIILNKPLPPNTYSLSIKNGSDGNKVLDNCDRSVPETETIAFNVLPVFPTPMDSITTVKCAPDLLQLVFSKPIKCNSIAANGSDFVVTGSTPVSVSKAFGHCDTGTGNSAVVYVQLSAPIKTKGNYTITLKRGSDGNTLIDECGEQTPAGQQLQFVTADTVLAAFTYDILYGCRLDTIKYQHPGGNGVNSWNWKFEDYSSSSTAHPQKIYSVFGAKQATLVVSNGVCADTISQQVLLDNKLKADFDAPEFICPEDTVFYKDKSLGRVVNWNWSFGNGAVSLDHEPRGQRYTPPFENQQYSIRLRVEDFIGCVDTISKEVTVVTSCYVSVPNAFTPNGDRLNDFLFPINAYKADRLIFRVFNKYGQKVFESRDRFTKWDGTVNGKLQASDNYVWTLEYIHKDTRQKFRQKGNTMLMQ